MNTTQTDGQTDIRTEGQTDRPTDRNRQTNKYRLTHKRKTHVPIWWLYQLDLINNFWVAFASFAAASSKCEYVYHVSSEIDR